MSLDPKIRDDKDLIFGVSPVPLKCGRGITLGGGTVYPEINFTLPQMEVTDDTWPAVLKQYKMMTTGVCERAVDLEAPGIVVEIELLPPMTETPARGGEITALVRGILDEFHEKRGLASALRMTPVDIRDYQQPPRMRSGAETKLVLESFEECARNGADLLSIESTGGKELHDKALLECDVPGIICALGVLAPRDMNFLWGEIEKIAQKYGVVSAGDTACGFANTAMVLADKGMIPKVVAAVDRVAATVRSLQAFHQGARGPSKDCAYEGPFLKVLTGMPISMEGRSAACAHLSGVGNIASAACDLWSNESVQNVRLLSGMAPTISMEQLIYDCRLMNQASADGRDAALTLRKWLVDSDAYRDPQAYVLKPDIVVELSHKIAARDTPLAQTIAAVEGTIEVINRAVEKGELMLSATESRWLGLLEMGLESTPDDEETLLATVQATISPDEPVFHPEEYPAG